MTKLLTAPDLPRGPILVRDASDVQLLANRVAAAAQALRARLIGFEGDGLTLLRHLKFDEFGSHPIEERALNAVEQINQTWTWLAALAAASFLLQKHGDCQGLRLAPGAHASQALDIMSVAEGIVGAEVFAAVLPTNNDKLARDLRKLSIRAETHRYVLFASPRFPGTRRLEQYERDGVQVWSLDV